jgi:hypothetical protein
MLKKVLSSLLAAVVLNAVAVSPTYANAGQDKEARLIEKVKENIRKLGTGPEARVEVKLLDNRKLKGYIKEVGEDGFMVVDEKTGAASTVDYSQVKQIKGSNHLTATKVGLNIAKGVLIVAAVAGVFTLLLALVVPKT